MYDEEAARLKERLNLVQRWKWGMAGPEKDAHGDWMWGKDVEAKVAEVAYLAYKAGLECGLKIGNL